MNVLYIIGIFLAFFISLLLFTKKNKSLSDKILALFILFSGVHLLNFYLYINSYWEVYPHLVGVCAPIPLVYGPLLYLYVYANLEPSKQLSAKHYFHFAPIVLAYLYMSPFIFLYTENQKRLVDSGELDDYTTFSYLLLIVIVVSIIVYPIVSFRLLLKYRKMILNKFSYNERINLKWLRNIILSLGFLFFVIVVIITLQYIFNYDYQKQLDNVFYGLSVILIFLFGYFGIKQENIFVDKDKPEQSKNKSYEKSGLSETKAKEIHLKLLDVMNSEKPYLEPKLSLSKLAQLLQVSPNNISQVINQFEKMNFYDFVNSYRVDEFKKLAQTNSNYSILSLALESGFNSKSSFNQIFKKYTGVTPSAYLSMKTAV
jgi:AraC-like DNA-binding protein